MDVNRCLKDILGLLSKYNQISINKDLLHIADNDIVTPAGSILPQLLRFPSRLPDKPIEVNLLNRLIGLLASGGNLVRLSHIGFCYRTESHAEEKERAINSLSGSRYHLYEEPSNDSGLWLFIGDANHWEDPTIEIIPVEKTADPQADYWLPHIQIDIDTNLSGEEIINIVNFVYGSNITPFPITIDGTVYIIRNRLGIIDGVNFDFDIATKSRNVRYLKQEIWQQLV